MLNRYPDQARSRKGYMLVGLVFLLFGVAMAFMHSAAGAIIGIVFGCILFFPPVLFGHARFGKYDKVLSWLAGFGSLS